MSNYKTDKNTDAIIEEIRLHLNLSEKSDVFCRAITLLKLAVDNYKKGGKVLFEVGGSTQEITLS